MGSGEEQARREAVMRVLGGEPPGKVAADLGRSDRWARKLVAPLRPRRRQLGQGSFSRSQDTVKQDARRRRSAWC